MDFQTKGREQPSTHGIPRAPASTKSLPLVSSSTVRQRRQPFHPPDFLPVRNKRHPAQGLGTTWTYGLLSYLPFTLVHSIPKFRKHQCTLASQESVFNILTATLVSRWTLYEPTFYVISRNHEELRVGIRCGNK